MIRQKNYLFPEMRHLTINRENNFCENFVSELPKGRKKIFGRFFTIIEAVGPAIDELIKKNIHSIILKSEQEYYSNEDCDIATALQKTIKKISPTIKKMCSQNDINTMVGVIDNSNLYFSKYGKIYACLHNKDGGLSAINTKNKRKTTAKSFSEIISVSIPDEDQILMLNDGFSGAFQTENIENLLKSDNDIFNSLKKYFETESAENRLTDSVTFAIAGIPKNIKEIQQCAKEEEVQQGEQERIEKEIKNNAALDASSNALSIINTILGATKNLGGISLPKNKLLTTVIIGLLIFLGVQIYQKASAQNQFEKISKIINDKKTEALIFASANNANGAIAKFLEARDTYASLENKSDPRLHELITDIEQELNKTAKITIINNPTKISDLSNFGIKFSPKNIFKSENQLMITGDDFGLAYKIDPENGRKGFSFFSTIDDRIKSATKYSNLAMFFTNENKVYIYNTETAKTNSFDFEKNDEQIISFDEKLVNIFDKNSGTLRQLSINNFHETSRMAISGQLKDVASDSKNIFILNGENELIKIIGKEQERLTDVNSLPLFGNPDLIITNKNLDNIYVIDKKQEQIASFTKNGQFLGQYDIENISEIVDLFIDDDKEIFILNNDGVYKVNL